MIAVDRLTLTYPGKTPALKNLSFNLKSGSWLGITGSNGSGKSSLLYALAGLIPRHIPAKISGTISVNQAGGLLFQNPDFSLFNLTVKEEVAFGAGGNVDQALKSVGLLKLKDADPQTLSYGQKQKVCLAGVLARNPQILLLDEPTAMLDYKSSLDLYLLLQTLRNMGKTIVTVEHDTALLYRFADQVLIIDQGKRAAFGPAKTVLKNQNLINRLGLRPL